MSRLILSITAVLNALAVNDAHACRDWNTKWQLEAENAMTAEFLRRGPRASKQEFSTLRFTKHAYDIFTSTCLAKREQMIDECAMVSYENSYWLVKHKSPPNETHRVTISLRLYT